MTPPPDAEPRVAHVYAVELEPGRYWAEVDRAHETHPLLLRDKPEAADYLKFAWSRYPSARVVKFELREVKEEA